MLFEYLFQLLYLSIVRLYYYAISVSFFGANIIFFFLFVSYRIAKCATLLTANACQYATSKFELKTAAILVG